jgi:methionyl-tRNA formyltransferase
MKISNVIFLGSKKFGYEILKRMYDCNKSIKWTIICPYDLNDHRTYFNKFKKFAIKNNLEILLIRSNKRIVDTLKKKKSNTMIVCGYYKILPSNILNMFKNGVWGIHNSLLPKYRGGSPLVWQLINGERKIGSTFFKFSKGIDDGQILKQIKIYLSKKLNINQATYLIEQRWKKEIPKFWREFCEGKYKLIKQNQKDATYFKMRKEKDGLIDWKKNTEEIDNFIKAQSYPYPGAYFFIKKIKIRILNYNFYNKKILGKPGEIYKAKSNYFSIICGNNSAIKITKIDKINGKFFSFSNLKKNLTL